MASQLKNHALYAVVDHRALKNCIIILTSRLPSIFHAGPENQKVSTIAPSKSLVHPSSFRDIAHAHRAPHHCGQNISTELEDRGGSTDGDAYELYDLHSRPGQPRQFGQPNSYRDIQPSRQEADRDRRRRAKRDEKRRWLDECDEMKFSHSIQFNAVPDWSSHYIAYSNLKKLFVFPPTS